MRIHYTGRNAEVSDEQKQKVQRKFEKVHKILRPKQSLEAHVTLSRQRHMCEAEVTLHALNHTFVVTGTGQEPYAALLAAADKLEKQAVKNKHKLIDVRRSERNRAQRFSGEEDAAPEAAGAKQKSGGKPKNHTPRVLRGSEIAPKPLSVEGAVLKLEELDRDHLTFRNAEDGRVNVLMRRRDGNLELIEAG
jgi:putative sigma-54 modulation protein